jgi:uncharacterized protein YecE (DUF72 family)
MWNNRSSDQSFTNLRIGCAGWNVPRSAEVEFRLAGSHLERYSQLLDCCEINSSFYRPHKYETWERWARSVPPDFRFSVKAPKAITHQAANSNQKVLQEFLAQIGFLGRKLGAVLFQLPPSNVFDRSRTEGFLALLRSHFPGQVVWEARHRSWFTDEPARLLRDFKINQVGADPACVAAASEPSTPASLAYFRLHGSPRIYYSSYCSDFLAELASRLKKSASRVETWCIFDNTAAGSAFANALELIETIQNGQASL